MTNLFLVDHTSKGLEVTIPPNLVRVEGLGAWVARWMLPKWWSVSLVIELVDDAETLGTILLREVEEDRYAIEEEGAWSFDD